MRWQGLSLDVCKPRFDKLPWILLLNQVNLFQMTFKISSSFKSPDSIWAIGLQSMNIGHPECSALSAGLWRFESSGKSRMWLQGTFVCFSLEKNHSSSPLLNIYSVPGPAQNSLPCVFNPHYKYEVDTICSYILLVQKLRPREVK